MLVLKSNTLEKAYEEVVHNNDIQRIFFKYGRQPQFELESLEILPNNLLASKTIKVDTFD